MELRWIYKIVSMLDQHGCADFIQTHNTAKATLIPFAPTLPICNCCLYSILTVSSALLLFRANVLTFKTKLTHSFNHLERYSHGLGGSVVDGDEGHAPAAEAVVPVDGAGLGGRAGDRHAVVRHRGRQGHAVSAATCRLKAFIV